MDEARSASVIASLIEHVGGAFVCERIDISMHSALRSRALVAIDIDIVCSKSHDVQNMSDALDDPFGIEMARELCESIRAQLVVPEQTATSLRMRLSMSLPKASGR
ncbi:hypothetical protein [Caballeronia sp. J97]|uniref:hypothetical protein n=1 Tax=Caballeronia sp. J97 TaxID=2805429 RepID=UPI002AB07BFB|nr:hypothetical protein [Caballeronia sp. J97]